MSAIPSPGGSGPGNFIRIAIPGERAGRLGIEPAAPAMSTWPVGPRMPRNSGKSTQIARERVANNRRTDENLVPRKSHKRVGGGDGKTCPHNESVGARIARMIGYAAGTNCAHGRRNRGLLGKARYDVRLIGYSCAADDVVLQTG
jgi:hypothetical protein